jgi:hypothetical protein
MASLLKKKDRYMLGLVHDQLLNHLPATIGSMMVVAGAFGGALWMWLRRRDMAAAGLVAGGWCVGMLFYVAVIVPIIDDGRTHREFVAEVAKLVGPDDLLMLHVGENHELSYLLDRPLVDLHTTHYRRPGEDWRQVLLQAAAEGRGAWYIVPEKNYDVRPPPQPHRIVLTEDPPHDKPLLLIQVLAEGQADGAGGGDEGAAAQTMELPAGETAPPAQEP